MGNSLDSYESLEYDQMSFKTGDLILFSGQGGMSRLIKCATFSPWSHVGIVLRIPDSSRFKWEGKGKNRENLYLFHSYNKEFEIDVISGEMKEGVQLNVLRDAIETYRKNGGRAFLRTAPRSFEDSVPKKKFMDWMIYSSHKQYEKSYYNLASSQVDCCCLPCFRNTGDNSSYFCSELVRDALSRLGDEKLRLCLGEYPDEFTPVDLSSGAYGFLCEPKVDLTELKWGEEVEIITNQKRRMKKKSPSAQNMLLKFEE